MPVTYQIDNTLGIVNTQCIGDVTVGEFIGHLEALSQDPDCPATLDVFLDLTKCLTIPENYQLEPVSHKIAEVRKKVQFKPCAIVVSGDLMY